MRIIDADALHDTILRDEKLDGKDVNWAVNRIISHILKAPTVDTTFKEVVAYECGQKSVEERPKGEWIEVDNGLVSGRCSLCRWEAVIMETDVCGMPFCPNCGADMRGDV